MASIKEEVGRRRTFAIISHPDAGKTTLTEKFLLYGGAINLAGSVKGKATARHAVSDWMEIEKQRGISVTSSVLQFEYGGCCVNLLDTPGHQDFSEDTYRTLMAADSAVMVIDASKGVEAQTRKLFQVCTMRHIPIFTFINKMDRDALDTFDLLDDIEKNLGIDTCPMNWPIGSGKGFRGVYERKSGEVILYSDTEKGTKEGKQERIPVSDEDHLIATIGEDPYETLTGEVELLDGASADFDLDAVRAGMLTPVFFGSALNNFGVEIFLQNFLEMALPPSARNADIGPIDPVEEGFSAFIFKIQANMNKAHRDRIAFMRICSGRYEGIPTFAPEHFARVRQVDTMKRDQFVKGITQIAQEGAIQIFQEYNTGMEEIICGVVGMLQFDVLKFRLKNEYNVEILLDTLPYEHIRWIVNRDIDPMKITGTTDMKRIRDLKGNPLLLFINPWSVGMVLDRNEGLELENFSRN